MNNKRLILLLILLTAFLQGEAQPPQYYHGLPAGVFASAVSLKHFPNWKDTSISGARIQSVYESAKSFATAPNGQLQNVYLKSCGGEKDSITTYYDFSISLGYTNKLGFRLRGANLRIADTFFKELMPVFKSKVFSKNMTNPNNQWVKFPVNSGNFYFDKSRNLVLEVAGGHRPPVNGLLLGNNVGDTSDWIRLISGPVDSPHLVSFPLNSPLDFGFDIKPTGVEALGNVSSYGLFPNPSRDGRVNLTLDGHQAFQNVVITVRSSIGQQVYSRQYENVGQSFFEEINLQGNPPGIYILEAVAGGQRIVQRMVLQ